MVFVLLCAILIAIFILYGIYLIADGIDNEDPIKILLGVILVFWELVLIFVTDWPSLMI